MELVKYDIIDVLCSNKNILDPIKYACHRSYMFSNDMNVIHNN